MSLVEGVVHRQRESETHGSAPLLLSRKDDSMETLLRTPDGGFKVCRVSRQGFRDRLRSLMEDASLSAGDLAEWCGVHWGATLFWLDRHRHTWPTVPHVIRLCEGFDVSMDYLVRGATGIPFYPGDRCAGLRDRMLAVGLKPPTPCTKFNTMKTFVRGWRKFGGTMQELAVGGME